MSKGIRNPLVAVIILLVTFGIAFRVYRIFRPQTPLRIRDLEDMRILTPRSSQEMGWTLTFLYDFGKWSEFGYINDGENRYEDSGNVASRSAPVCLIVYKEAEPIAIQGADRLEITYDGGQTLLIYLPPQIRDEKTSLYIARDGATYYNKRLTKLAQGVPELKRE
jgi:hypothetical protein